MARRSSLKTMRADARLVTGPSGAASSLKAGASNGQSQGFTELVSFLAGAPAARLRRGSTICVVTNELVAFHKNGGIGTANTGLVETLSQHGCQLSVIYTARLDTEASDVRAAIASLKGRGIEFIPLQDTVPPDWMNSPRKISYGCYWLLRRLNPSIVHFNDYLGNGFYAAQARHCGTALHDTAIIVTVHGPTRWALTIDERPIATPEQQEVCFLEERTLEFADAVLGVSHHLLAWLRNDGVCLPKHSYVHKNIMPHRAGPHLPRRLGPGDLSEVVFFGRQDVRKGFELMLRAIRELSTTLPQLKFTFLGKFSTVCGEHSGALALDALSGVANPIAFRHDLDRFAALRYLRRAGVLAVIPSVDENSPCTVLECIMEGIPFIASAVGGITELISDAHHASVLFASDAASLAAKIRHVADNGVNEVALAFDPPAITGQMVSGFAALRARIMREQRARRALAEAQTPLVSVIVAHFNRPTLLLQLLGVLEQQTYTNFEVVLVDDGSTDAAALACLDEISNATFRYPLTVIRAENRYLGAARNAGVARARGEFVKFQDDDNVPMPHEIEYFVRAAMYSGADIVTGMSRFFKDDDGPSAEVELAQLEYFPLGASLPLALATNEYGDANALVRRACFLEDGGFSELRGIGSEDYEYFLKSESRGRKIVFVPEPLFNYRISGVSMLQTTSVYKGACRARSGLTINHQRWLEKLIDFTHQSALARDIESRKIWRSGKRPFADLHRRLTTGDPNSQANVDCFIDLAKRYGRPACLLELTTPSERIFDFGAFPNIELVGPTEDLPTGFALMRLRSDGLLVHPLSNRMTQVLVRQALPAATTKVSVRFSHRNALGGTVRMGFSIISGAAVIDSAWVDVAPRTEVQATVLLDTPVFDACDLLLQSTINGSQDCAWTYADHVCIKTDGGAV